MKITVLGAAGGVGQALSFSLIMKLPSGSELTLYDISPAILGIAMDLSHIPKDVKITGLFGKDIDQALKGTDIVMISAGASRKLDVDRFSLFDVNASIIKNLIEQVAIFCPQACIGIITNPLNATVVVAAETLKKIGVYNKNKLFGITTLDIIRASTFVSELVGKKSNPINVPVIGGHSSTTILPLLSQIQNCNFSDKEIIDLTKRIQNAGNEVVKAKSGNGSSTLSMGQAAALFTSSLVRALQGEKDIIEFSYVEDEGKYVRFFSQPLLLGKNGIEERKPIGKLSDFEKKIMKDALISLQKDITLGENFANK